MNLPKGLRHKFSHIYIEEEISSWQETERICAFFPAAEKVYVHHYNDVFARRRQSPLLQKQCQNLILACKHDQRIYPGSPVCQNFDERYFYYCAPAMNCLYDCEYCWLRGMYPSGNLVIFLNQEDFMKDVDTMLIEHPVYLCIAYETDLLAMESLLGYGKWWAEKAAGNPGLTIEIRTKAPYSSSWKQIPVSDRVIFAFTLSPDSVINACEHGTASLAERLSSVRKCMEEGRKVRLCFDPVIPVRNWKEAYQGLVRETAEAVDMSRVRDVSVGTFRISRDYLRNMRRAFPESAVIQYPYICENGFYHLPDALEKEMEDTMMEELSRFIGKDRIFTWEK